ncbi:MAG: hypothetical protein ACTSPB_00155 [Candidatus Thorarchaeota archaeon]
MAEKVINLKSLEFTYNETCEDGQKIAYLFKTNTFGLSKEYKLVPLEEKLVAVVRLTTSTQDVEEDYKEGQYPKVLAFIEIEEVDITQKSFPLSAKVWFRESTQEWVLEIDGTINDTNFNVRHPQPKDTLPEEVAELKTLYDEEVA